LLSVCWIAARPLKANEPKEQSCGNTQQLPLVVVYVAAKKIPVLKKLREPSDFFVAKAIPAEAVPANAVLRLDDVRDKRMTKTLAEGSVLRADDVHEDKPDNSHPIIPNLRHSPLSLSDCFLPSTGLAPGMRVDVIVVFGGNEVGLKDLLVHAITPALPGDKPTDPAQPPQLLLEVTPEEHNRLVLMLASCKVIVREHKQE
jgi:Flp pilus assembly protein CpaB